MYFLSNLVLGKLLKDKRFSRLSGYKEYLAIASSFFYLFNLATIQIFSIQLEAFIVHFAALPWLFWIVFRTLKKPSKKNLALFLLINFFASIQAFIPPLFVAYILGLLIILSVRVLRGKKKWFLIKRTAFILLLTLAINSYWLIPFNYYLTNQSKVTLEAYNNLISTAEFMAQSRKYGNLENVSLLKGFYWEGFELGDYIFTPWLNHHQNSTVPIIGYLLFSLVIVGLLTTYLLRKHWFIVGFCLIFLFFFANLAIDVWPFSYINSLISLISPTFSQAFRITFTKLGFGVGFTYALFLSICLLWLINLLKRKLKKPAYLLIAYSAIVFSMFYYAWPYFGGNFFYKKILLDVPQPYFDSIEFFKDKKGRIAELPQDCPEGWYGLSWGYFGSGFLWYGLSQPVLSRSADVWSNYSEDYYWQLTQALRENDWQKTENVLEKFGTKWLIYDENTLHCASGRALKSNVKFSKYLEKESVNYDLVKVFKDNNRPIKIYENKSATGRKSFVRFMAGLPNIGPGSKFSLRDQGYIEMGDYITEKAQPFDVLYPFRSLFTGRKQDEKEFSIEDKGDSFIFSNPLPYEAHNYQMIVSEEKEWEGIFLDENLEKTPVTSPSVRFGKDRIDVEIKKQKSYFSYDSEEDKGIFRVETKSCDNLNIGLMERGEIKEGNKRWLRMTSQGSSNCLSIDLDRLSQKTGYLIKIDSRNLQGQSLKFKVTDKTGKRVVLETFLPQVRETSFFILPPLDEFGIGYSLIFDNVSIGRERTINDLGRIEVYPIPYRFLKQIKLVNGEQIKRAKYLDKFSVRKYGPWLYKIDLPKIDDEISNTSLILSQAHHSGWKAFYLDGFRPIFLNHVLVNNWANGWQLSGNGRIIYIIFWPQLLEFLGFGILGATLLWLVFWKRK